MLECPFKPGMYILQNKSAGGGGEKKQAWGLFGGKNRPKIGEKNAKLGVFRAILGINLWFLGIARVLYAC